MSNPTLPTGFLALADAYSAGDPGGVLRDEVAGGVAAYALDWQRGLQRYTITLQLTGLQFSVWCAFYFHVIKKGAITFDMPLASGANVATHAVTIVPGSYATARLGATGTAVSFVVEAENKVYG